MRKIYLGLLLAVGFFSEVSAQQDPHYTQYMYNMSVMNPAYAGSNKHQLLSSPRRHSPAQRRFNISGVVSRHHERCH